MEEWATLVADLGPAVSDWWNSHGVVIVTIVLSMYLLQYILTRTAGKIIKHTIRPDLFPTKNDRDKRVKTLNGLIVAVLRIGSFLLALVMVLQNLNVNTAPLLASAGVVGITFGIGAQSLIKDFVSGIFIISENQYRIGDLVDIQGVSGTVEAVTVRTTVLRDPNGAIHHIPNGSIVITTNRSMGYGRINLDITVDAKTNLELLEKIINDIGKRLHEDEKYSTQIIEAPHFGHVVDYGTTGIVLKVLGKTANGKQLSVRSAFYQELQRVFKEHHIVVPRAFNFGDSKKK